MSLVSHLLFYFTSCLWLITPVAFVVSLSVVSFPTVFSVDLLSYLVNIIIVSLLISRFFYIILFSLLFLSFLSYFSSSSFPFSSQLSSSPSSLPQPSSRYLSSPLFHFLLPIHRSVFFVLGACRRDGGKKHGGGG